jgi:hypothetical protein
MAGCAAGGWYLLISALLKFSTLLPSKSPNGLTGRLRSESATIDIQNQAFGARSSTG